MGVIFSWKIPSLCLGEQSFKHADVLSKKINFSAPGVQNPPFLKQMMLTHYTLRSVLFRPHQTPVYVEKWQNVLFLSLFVNPKKNIYQRSQKTQII